VNGQRALVAAFLLAQVAACAAGQAPVSMPARCTEKPPAETVSRIDSASAESGETVFNAKRWKFATFFNRVKTKVKEHWQPVEEYRRRDSDGTLYGQQDRTTLLHVCLRADGSLDRITILRSSGLDFLDEFAEQAFQEAQPFAEPPCQLIGNTGLVQFDFGFRLEVAHPAAKLPDPAATP
jgi:TonB family protein